MVMRYSTDGCYEPSSVDRRYPFVLFRTQSVPSPTKVPPSSSNTKRANAEGTFRTSASNLFPARSNNFRPRTAPRSAGGVDVSLWNGDENTGVRMIEGRLSANGKRVISDEQGTTVELISHAVYRNAP